MIPVGAGEAGFIAVLSPPAPVAVTNATNVVTGPAVVAVAFLLTLDSEGSLWTGVLTRFSHPASQAHAGPRLSVADPSILTRAVLQAAVPVCPRSALLFTSQSRPAVGTSTVSCDMVTGSGVPADTLLKAVLSKGTIWAGLLALFSGPPRGTDTLPADMVTLRTIKAMTLLFAFTSISVLWALLVAGRANPAI